MGSHVNPPLFLLRSPGKTRYGSSVAEVSPCYRGIVAFGAGRRTRRSMQPSKSRVHATPRHATSAMDGFAIRSKDTASASPKNPTRFRVRPGTVAAGDDPGRMHGHTICDGDEKLICVEIATGGIFPAGFDACVRFEDTEDEIPPLSRPYGVDAAGRERCILVHKPIPSSANGRFAGSDIHKGQMLLREGEFITLAYVLPLAAAGYTSISVNRRPYIAIVSTGNKLFS